MSEDSEACPNCGGRRVAAPARTLQLVVTKKYVCGDCGAEWRRNWKAYLATAGLFGGGAVALGAGGFALATFLAADSEAFDWQTWRTIGVALIVTGIAGVAAKQGWRFLRTSPDWIIVEKPGLTVERSLSGEFGSAPARRWNLSRWKGLAEWALVTGFLTLAAVIGTESYQERRERESRTLPRGPSQLVFPEIPARQRIGLRPEATTSRPGADDEFEPFPDDIQRKVDAWLNDSPAEAEEPSAPAERYYDRSWSKPAE